MKTTLILRDDLVRRAKARAALCGQPMSRFVEESLERALRTADTKAATAGSWLDELPRGSRAAAREARALFERDDFREIDAEMWR